MSSWAAQPDLVRALQKDAFYLDSIVEQVKDLFSLVAGSRSARYEGEAALLSSALYHGVTTLSRRRTLGEEYGDLHRVTSSRCEIPSQSRMSAFVLLKVILPYLQTVCSRTSTTSRPGDSFTTRLSNLIRRTVHRLKSVFERVDSLHLAAFYLFGRYLTLSDRFCGIRYLYTRRVNYLRPGYQILGVLLLLRLSMSLFMHIRSGLRRAPDTSVAEQAESVPRGSSAVSSSSSTSSVVRVCSLCLGRREHPTATDCGHVFCWDCICAWCSNKAECPLCRQPLNPSNFIALAQYT